MSVKALVLEKFSDPHKCYGHCDQQATVRILKEDTTVITALDCPSAYVSRIVAYGEEVQVPNFKSFVESALNGSSQVADEDIRTATRYSWDLNVAKQPAGKVLGVAYWVQNYRRSKTDDPNRLALFSCSKCHDLFVQPVSSKETLCYTDRPH